MHQQNKKYVAKSRRGKRILVVNVSNPLSHGGAAIAISLLKNLRVVFPDAEVSLMTTRESDVFVYTEKYDFSRQSFVKHTWFRNKGSNSSSLFASFGPATGSLLSCVSYNFLSRLGMKSNNIYQDYDIVLDLSSDSLNEFYGAVYPLFSLFQLELALLCKKKVVVCPASIGPFKNKVMRSLVAHTLSKTDLVIARGAATVAFLRQVGVPKSKTHFAADLAFLFEPVSKDYAGKILASLSIPQDDRPLIGIAPSSEIYRYCFPNGTEPQAKYSDYVKLMADVTDFVIKKFDSEVLFIPHFVYPEEFVKNDKIACRDICGQVKNKSHVKILLGDYRADEVKGVIGLCDMVVSCRMHAAIAAMSSGVPTVAVSFGQKFHSILGKTLGQGKCIVDTGTDYSKLLADLKETVAYVWSDRASIRRDLNEKTLIAKQSALSSFDKIKEILDKANTDD